MIRYDLEQVSALLGAELRPGNAATVTFTGLASDSRDAAALRGALFVALRGPNFDGHAFVPAAAEHGAAAALVEHWVDCPLPQLKVEQPLHAMGRLAAAWRRRFPGRLIALTGSNGKTTTKEMLAAIVAEAGSVMATAGNLNNDIGVPLTLARLAGQDFAIVEMGANHAGEIAYLTELAQPQVALITNAGPAHLEGFGDLAGVACAKGEIYQGLQPDGCAVINADDAFADYWRSLLSGRPSLDFALNRPALVCGEYDAAKGLLHIVSTGGTVAVRPTLPGRHNLYNALAAATAALAAGVDLAAVKRGLESVQPVAGRLQRLAGPYRSTLIDDTYNANPASLTAALQVLTDAGNSVGDGAGDGDGDGAGDGAAAGAEAWLVLGDMAELGAGARALHREAGAQAKELGVRRLYALGRFGRLAAQAFGSDGRHFDSPEALCAALADDLARRPGGPPCRVLVKGSRSMRMERVVNALSRLAAATAGGHAGSVTAGLPGRPDLPQRTVC